MLGVALLGEVICLVLINPSLVLHVAFVTSYDNYDILIIGVVSELSDPFLDFLK